MNPSPQEFGVGARITLAVMADDYVDVILSALAQTDATGLEIITSNVSTYVGGAEADILRYLRQLISATARTGKHVSAVVHFSRGCPGGVSCAPGPLSSEIPSLAPAGVQVSAEWALYPLADAGTPDHMRDIYAAIDFAKTNGTFIESKNFVTRLSGDLAKVLETVAAGWILVGRTVQHVATHVTISVNSPTV